MFTFGYVSQIQLNDDPKSLLMKGMKFAIIPKHTPKEKINAKVESSLKEIDKPEADTIRANVSLTPCKSRINRLTIYQKGKQGLKE